MGGSSIVQTDIGHGRGWLNSPAAASLKRVDRAVGAAIGRVLQVSEAGRTNARQWVLWNLYYWLVGGRWVARPKADRPSWLGAPAYPGTSPHEAGNAVDTNDWISPLVYAILRDHGWRCWSQAEPGYPAKGEPWHWVYYPFLDNHRNEPVSLPIDLEDIMANEQIGKFSFVLDGNLYVANGTFGGGIRHLSPGQLDIISGGASRGNPGYWVVKDNPKDEGRPLDTGIPAFDLKGNRAAFDQLVAMYGPIL